MKIFCSKYIDGILDNKVAVLVAVILGLSACQTAPVRPLDREPEQRGEAVTLPFEEPAKIRVGLSKELLYQYLLAEIAAKRGEFHTSLEAYEQAAVNGQDAYAAERATRVAWHVKDYSAGLRSVRRWVEHAPNSIAARKFGALLFLENGNNEGALEQLNALLKIADAKSENGFLMISGALMGARNGVAATRLMRSMLSEHANDPDAHFALGMLLTRQQNWLMAEQALNEAIALRPDWSEPYVLLVQVLNARGDGDKALKRLETAVADNPEDTVLRNSYARLLVDKRRYSEALTEFRVLVQLLPSDKDLKFALAMLATQEKQWAEARALWQELRNDADRYHDATYYLAQIEAAEGNYVLAMGLYASVKEGGLEVDATIRHASLQADHGSLNEARELLANARLKHPGRVIDLYLAELQILQEIAESEEALVLYEQALEAFPNNTDLLYARGIYAVELERFDWMERDLRRVLQIDADHVDALNALGYTYADRDMRLDEAFALVAHALRLRPDSAVILDSMGWVYYRKGDFEQAVKYLKQAHEARSDEEIAAHLGEVLWVSGDKKAAETVWQEALNDYPESDILRKVLKRFGVSY